MNGKKRKPCTCEEQLNAMCRVHVQFYINPYGIVSTFVEYTDDDTKTKVIKMMWCELKRESRCTEWVQRGRRQNYRICGMGMINCNWLAIFPQDNAVVGQWRSHLFREEVRNFSDLSTAFLLNVDTANGIQSLIKMRKIFIKSIEFSHFLEMILKASETVNVSWCEVSKYS